MSVIVMREPSSFSCTRAAKMLTSLFSRSAAIAGGRPASGRGASSSSTNDAYDAPTPSTSLMSAAPMSRQATSLMTVTRSCGWTFRQTRTALAAPGCRSNSNFRLRNHEIDDGRQVAAGRLPGADLAVGTGAVLEDPPDVVHRVPAPQLIQHIVDPREVLGEQRALRRLALLAEVDQRAVDAVPQRAPLVLHQQRPAVLPPALILLVQPVELYGGRLNQRGDGQGLVHAHRDVADAYLERRENRMRPDVPPDLLGVVDRVRLHEQIDERLEIGPRAEGVGNVGARETVEHLAPVGLEAGVHADPERRVGREREQVRQEVPHLVHEVD